MAENEETKPRKGGTPKGVKKARSPSYPGVTIDKALALAKTAYEQEKRNEASADTLFGHWKYKPKSSPGLVALAALKAYGLLEANKATGNFKLTPLALRIILDEREEEFERLQWIKTAALNPPIHKVLWEKYGAELPSDANLRFHLMNDREFTKVGADQFIAQYKDTLKWVLLVGGGTMSGRQDDEPPTEEPSMTTQTQTQPPPDRTPPPTSGSFREVPIPIAGAAWPSLKASFPMKKAAWDQMLSVLRAMEPGLVLPESSDKDAAKD